MTILYKPVLIESAEQAEALPSNTKFHTDPATAFSTRTEWQGDCLVWVGPTDEEGYGRISVDGKWYKAHRYAWEQENGPIAPGMKIDHKCWNHPCVNIKHLRQATNAQNVSNASGPRKTNLSTGVRNVYPKGKKFRVQIVKDGKSYRFGVYDSIEEASIVAEEKRRELFGEFSGRG